jgi:pimeloyl-ACP methyl ester carboxylesterase
LTSLADDVAATQRAIALETGPLLLVGHSYGGVVISQAGNDPKVAGLVFVAAYAPDKEQSGLSLAMANPTPVDTQIPADAFGFTKLTQAGIFQDFAPELSDAEKNLLLATEIPTSVASLGTALLVAPAWKTKPNWFIVASHDRVISPQLEESQAQQMNATTIALPSCHVVMLEFPFPVADFIKDAAETLSR